MKRIFVFFMAFLFLAGIVPAYAAQGRKGASDKAYEHASDEAIFHRVTDWFATIGKTEEEKEAILAERKTERAARRAQKKAKQEKKKAEKEGKRLHERIKDKIKGRGSQ